jgi:hypothetical protein
LHRGPCAGSPESARRGCATRQRRPRPPASGSPPPRACAGGVRCCCLRSGSRRQRRVLGARLAEHAPLRGPSQGGRGCGRRGR